MSFTVSRPMIGSQSSAISEGSFLVMLLEKIYPFAVCHLPTQTCHKSLFF